MAAMSGTTPAAADAVRIKVMGGLAGVTQYTRFEEPFWTRRIAELSGGRLVASIKPFDKSGLRGQDMLQLMRLGVVPWGTVPLSAAVADEPELGVVDLAGMNPDIESLRRTVAAYRPHLAATLARHGVELLAVYAYPAQVIYCKEAFGGLQDLKGRRVRTSSVAQSEFVEGLGAVGVITPFAEIVPALSTGVVNCAITGTLSGAEIGLPAVTSHVHAMAVSWGVTLFGVSQAAWTDLPTDLRMIVRSGVGRLEAEIWRSAEHETARGLACNTGDPSCGDAARMGGMTLVRASAADEAKRRALLVGTVLPRWIERCGSPCVSSWEQRMRPILGLDPPAH